MSEKHLESIILEENKKEDVEEPVYIWDALSSIAKTVSEQSKKAVQTYSHELGDFFATVKEEATEAFHIQEKSIKSQISELSEGIDSALPQKVKEDASSIFKYIGGIIFETDEEEEEEKLKDILKTEFVDVSFDSVFLTNDHTIDSKWTEFKELTSAKLLDVHKQTILANDQSLKDLYHETVPDFVTEDAFWEHWSYYNYLKKNPKKKLAIKEEKGSDWGSWDNEEASVLSIPKAPSAVLKEEETSRLGDSAVSEGWDEWN